MDLDAEESVSERVARLITHQAEASGCSSPDSLKVRKSPRLSAKSDTSAGSEIRSGSPPKHKLKTLSFDDALVSPTPEEQKARGRVEARKRRHKKDPEEGNDGKKKEPFIIRPTFDAIGRELISLVAATLREIGKQDVEAPTKAAETALLPLAQKMSKVLDRGTSKVRTELVRVEGLGNTYGFKVCHGEEGINGVLAYASLILHVLPREAIPGPTGCDGIPRGARVTFFLRMEHGAKWEN